ncbi:winged helix-turn-helix transcriptional regulator [Bacillus velezensis]|uniref:winged helix-turn-helix transcriptional regulator n=1 Tax=Bacillus velezensis TaxID=492670 RepID=UPI0037BF6DB5
MLLNHLTHLHHHLILHTQLYPLLPPKLDYSLTPQPQTLMPILHPIYNSPKHYIQLINIHKTPINQSF